MCVWFYAFAVIAVAAKRMAPKTILDAINWEGNKSIK